MSNLSSAACIVGCFSALLALSPQSASAQKPHPMVAALMPAVAGKLDDKIFVFESAAPGGSKDRKPYLNGLTATGTTSLSPLYHAPKADVSGTRWKCVKLSDGTYGLKCLGDGKGVTWLDGWTTSGDVKMAKETSHNFTGTHWKIHDANGKYQIECRGAIEGPRFLDADPATGKLKLTKSQTEAGTFWKLMPSKAGSL